MEYILDSLLFIFYAYSSHIHSKPSDSSAAAVSARGPITYVEDTTIEHHRKHAIRTIVKYTQGNVYKACIPALHLKTYTPGLKILVTDANRRQMRTTTNVVFKEIFQNVK
ncbi:ATP-dependent DNA helicase PIF1-like [Senna tora]|uniref:ATP-dependent DNA helicase PIF1-like n=1 Tax=Senna tora TaxID=362788 RepID=A0A834VYJ1_9FABA|nr:ATP-dependent DNA helicase PIF1-like [Senna tora]